MKLYPNFLPYTSKAGRDMCFATSSDESGQGSNEDLFNYRNEAPKNLKHSRLNNKAGFRYWICFLPDTNGSR